MWRVPPDIIRWDGNVSRPAMAHIVLRPSRLSDFRLVEMTLRTKMAVVGTVLVAGTVAALCFRKPVAETQAPAQSNATLPLRDRDAGASAPGTPAAPQGVPLPAGVGNNALVTGENALSGDPVGSAKPKLTPPQLPPGFNPNVQGSASEAGKVVDRPQSPPPLPDLRGSLRQSQPLAPVPRPTPEVTSHNPQPVQRPLDSFERPAVAAERPAPWRSHTVMDGDTLSTLATRYLGSAGRFAEILEANRSLLRNADMLPIGTVLRIPPQSASPTSPLPMPTGDPNRFPHLVPIPAGALTSRDSAP